MSEDKEKLALMVKSHGLKHVIKMLADVANDETTLAADQLLKDKSHKWAVNTLLLDKLALSIEE